MDLQDTSSVRRRLRATDLGSAAGAGEAVFDRNAALKEAIDLGIGMVFQHFMLAENLTVWENVVLGHQTSKAFTKGPWIDKALARRAMRAPMAGRFWQRLAPAGGLTLLGASRVVLKPGGWSSAGSSGPGASTTAGAGSPGDEGGVHRRARCGVFADRARGLVDDKQICPGQRDRPGRMQPCDQRSVNGSARGRIFANRSTATVAASRDIYISPKNRDAKR